MKLSKRLQIIYDLVPKGIPADIGSDHGKLMIALFEGGKIEKGYATDNKEGPYERLKQNILKAGLIDHVIPLFSDGLDDLPLCVDTLIIAGMGGYNIINILKKHPEKLNNIQTIIVDAHSGAPEVRRQLSLLGFAIAEEKIIKEKNIFYEIIKFIRSDQAFFSDEDLEFGPFLKEEKCATFKEKYQSRIAEIEQILKNGNLPQERIISLQNEKYKLKRFL